MYAIASRNVPNLNGENRWNMLRLRAYCLFEWKYERVARKSGAIMSMDMVEL
jgi:hypothetical protein